MVNLAGALAAMGHEVFLFSLFPGDEQSFYFEGKSGMPYMPLWAHRSRFLPLRLLQILAAPVRLRAYLRTCRCEFVYSMLYSANLLAWLATRGALGGSLVWGLRSSNMKLNWKRAIPDRLCAWLSFSVPLVIANSAAGWTAHRDKGYRPKRHAVIPNGIDTNQFVDDPALGIGFRLRMGVAADEKLVGMVGRLDPMKDHPTFLRAAVLIADRREDVRFVVVGGGNEGYIEKLASLAQEAGSQGRLHWAGEMREMAGVYNGLDVLVSSSAYGEGFPNVIGEAMACGVPCVATDVGDSASVIGNLGEVVPPKDPVAISDAVLRLLGSDDARRAARREWIRREFSVERMATSTLEAMLGRSPSANSGA
jgi:glycosyltransferase involved in cell wall biosynthesis